MEVTQNGDKVHQTDFWNGDLSAELSHGICCQQSGVCGRQRNWGWIEELCYQLAVAGLLHDVGKQETGDRMFSSVAGKGSSFCESRRLRYVRTHPTLGYAIPQRSGTIRKSFCRVFSIIMRIMTVPDIRQIYQVTVFH